MTDAPFTFTDKNGAARVLRSRKCAPDGQLDEFDATRDDLKRAVEAQNLKLVDAAEWRELLRECDDVRHALATERQQVEQLTARVEELETENHAARTTVVRARHAEGDAAISAAKAERERDEARAELERVKAELGSWRRTAERLGDDIEKQRAVVEAVREWRSQVDASVRARSFDYGPEKQARTALMVVFDACQYALVSAGSEPKPFTADDALQAVADKLKPGAKVLGVGSPLPECYARAEPKRAGGESEAAKCAKCGGSGYDYRGLFPLRCECQLAPLLGREPAPATEEPAPKQGEALRVGLPINGPYADVPLWPIVDRSELKTIAYATSEAAAKRICNAPAGVPVERLLAVRDRLRQGKHKEATVVLTELIHEFTAKPDAGGGG